MSRSKNNGSRSNQPSRSIKNKIPPELNRGPMMEVCSNREITIDGCRGIAEYNENGVKINTTDGIVAICGRSLNIKYLSVTSVVIAGYITSIEFVR